MCDETITPHNHSVLYSNVALQADIYFDLQAQVRIFLTLHILNYSMQVNIMFWITSPTDINLHIYKVTSFFHFSSV